MLVKLRSLFGLACLDEAMPGGTERDCATALVEAPVLRTAMERAPVMDIANKPGPEQKPDLKPEPAPSVSFRR